MCVVCTVLHDNQLTHTDLKPENILFVNSDADVVYDPQKVGTNTTVGDFSVDIDMVVFFFSYVCHEP